MNQNLLSETLRIKGFDNLPLVDYEPASLREYASCWYIEYRVLNPESCKLERKRLRFEKIRKRLGTDTKARRFAKIYCEAINGKLSSGWNPFLEGKNPKSFHVFTDTFKSFLREKELDYKNGVFSYDSMRTYKSQIEIFTTWLNKKDTSICVGTFTKELAQEYLDFVYIEKQLSPRTWNNYLAFLRTLWNWLIEKNYCTENIFSKIKSKPKVEKERIIISEDANKQIIEYFRQNNPAMELVCGLIYNSFMRPAEICRTQIKDIHISKNAIYLTGAKTKNKHARWCLLPPHLIDLLIKHGIDKYPLDYYLFSSELVPGKKPLCTRKIDKYWHKMREKIGLPKEMQLYSYRDTGITDLKKAGHSNLFISSITGHRNSEEIETYTHEPDMNALRYIVEQSKQL